MFDLFKVYHKVVFDQRVGCTVKEVGVLKLTIRAVWKSK
jgi:hypothetical protein